MPQTPSRWLIPGLGVTQIVGWGALFYAYGVLMQPIQDALQTSKPVIVGAYSLALLISGCLSTLAGSVIDRIGGRRLMCGGSLLAAAMLFALSRVDSVTGLYLVWAGLGAAMSATLYPAAFAVLTRAFGDGYRRAITLVTLFGGFASTVFWPLTHSLNTAYGWRHTLVIYAVMNLVLCLPIHALLPVGARTGTALRSTLSGVSSGLSEVLRQPLFYLVTLALTLNALVFAAMALHMVPVLRDAGLTPADAVLVGAMIGPMQVLGRVLEASFGHKVSSRDVGLLALCLLPLSLGILLSSGGLFILFLLFAVAFGIGNGVMTIVRGTLPAELYGTGFYGAVSGAMSAPILIASASGPFVASLLYSATGGYTGTLLVLAGISATGAAIFFYAMRTVRPVAASSNPIT